MTDSPPSEATSKTYSGFRLPISEAERCASLAGIGADLRAVVNYCDQLISNSTIDRLNVFVWEAMSAAAVVRYARCFSKGVRIPLQHALLDGAPDEHRHMHDYVMDLRNKHIAHSVNAFEENVVTVQVGDHFHSSAEICSFGAVHSQPVGLGFEQPPLLKALAEWVLVRVGALVKAEEAKLLPIVKSMPLEQIRSFGMHTLGQRGNAKVGKARSSP